MKFTNINIGCFIVVMSKNKTFVDFFLNQMGAHSIYSSISFITLIEVLKFPKIYIIIPLNFLSIKTYISEVHYCNISLNSVYDIVKTFIKMCQLTHLNLPLVLSRWVNYYCYHLSLFFLGNALVQRSHLFTC